MQGPACPTMLVQAARNTYATNHAATNFAHPLGLPGGSFPRPAWHPCPCELYLKKLTNPVPPASTAHLLLGRIELGGPVAEHLHRLGPRRVGLGSNENIRYAELVGVEVIGQEGRPRAPGQACGAELHAVHLRGGALQIIKTSSFFRALEAPEQGARGPSKPYSCRSAASAPMTLKPTPPTRKYSNWPCLQHTATGHVSHPPGR